MVEKREKDCRQIAKEIVDNASNHFQIETVLHISKKTLILRSVLKSVFYNTLNYSTPNFNFP
jgi:hypothetical protein